MDLIESFKRTVELPVDFGQFPDRRRLVRGLVLMLILVLILFTAVRIGSAQPTVQTMPATDITAASAQLNGNLNTNGHDTEWAFKVFDSSGIEIQTVCSGGWTAGSVGQSSVNCPVYGLQPSTKYGHALIARWSGVSGASGNWQLGKMVSFTTSPLIITGLTVTIITPKSGQPSATTLAATDITSTSATLNGKVVTNGQDTYWLFGYYQGNSFLGWCPAPPGNVVSGANSEMSVKCSISSLHPSTTYSFFLEDGWAGGPTQKSGLVDFTTLAGSTGPTAPGFDFMLSVSPSTVSVKQGDTAHYAVSVTYSDPSYAGTVINLQLTGLGPGMDWHVTPSGDLTVTTTATTPTGSYTLSLMGSAGGVTHPNGVMLIVTSTQPATTAVTTTAAPATTATSSAPFDYSVTVSPSSQSVENGGSASYVVSVLPLSGTAVPVSLTLMGCPGDVRSGFTIQSANPPYTSTLNLDLSTSSANAGAYTLTVLASAGGNVKTATASLMIHEKTAHTTFAQTTTTSGSNWSDVLQQNNLLVIAALLAVAVVLGVLAMRGRGQRSVPQQMAPTRTFCGKCGAENPIANEFCGYCGNRLKGS